MAENFKQSNILICGSSRVGKSTLINAICRKELSKSNASLSSHTKSIDQYSSQSVVGHVTYETNFWDTPGIESWNESDVRTFMISLIERTQPLCMIYCASPGSFAVLDHVAWIVSECHRKNIFCALVCTNMWAGRNRQNIIDEFCKVLNSIFPQIQPTKEDGIIFYDRLALVTMVNSIQHVDEDFGVTKPPSGINELIFAIAKCLERDFMIAWFRAVSENKSFWSIMSSQLCSLFKIPYKTFNAIRQQTENFLELLIDFSEFDDAGTTIYHQTKRDYDDHDKSFPKTATEDSLFYDAEMIEMPSSSKPKQLSFTLKSKDMIPRLSNGLVELGASEIQTHLDDESTESKFVIDVKFQDENKLKAIYDIWQMISQTEVTCAMIEDSLTEPKDNVS